MGARIGLFTKWKSIDMFISQLGTKRTLVSLIKLLPLTPADLKRTALVHLLRLANFSVLIYFFINCCFSFKILAWTHGLSITGKPCVPMCHAHSSTIHWTFTFRLVKESVQIPVVANGDVTSLDSAIKTRDFTGVDGVMVARALLENPALFAGYNVSKIPVFDVQASSIKQPLKPTCFITLSHFLPIGSH